MLVKAEFMARVKAGKKWGNAGNKIRFRLASSYFILVVGQDDGFVERRIMRHQRSTTNAALVLDLTRVTEITGVLGNTRTGIRGLSF